MKIIEKDGYKIILSDKLCALNDCVLALGKFDGLHVAHRSLLLSAQELRERIGASYAGVWCFEENPLSFFVSEPPKEILPIREKIKLFFEAGMDFCVLASFKKFKDIPPEEFIREHLMGELDCRGAVCGYNFRFSKDRTGTPEVLQDFFGKESTVVVDKIELDGVAVSSSEIRKFISEGDMESAHAFLGRPYSINTVVTGGKKLGRKISFPTANQNFPDSCVIPKFAIYATLCTTENGEKHIGVSNVGVRPTIVEGDTHAVNCETYIIDFNSDIYGQDLKIEFYKLLREEKKFSSVDELREAIKRDAKGSASYFESIGVRV